MLCSMERFSTNVNKVGLQHCCDVLYVYIFQLTDLTGSTADTYLEYIQRNLPEGVAMKVTKVLCWLIVIDL